MSELKFKTNINCTGCLSKAAPILDDESSIEKWEVDLKSENRTLTVLTTDLNAEQVKAVVEKAGFTADSIK